MYDKQNFFAILPARVRYDVRLERQSVLLYAALTSLAVSQGVVFAGNNYLSEILSVSEASVKRYLRTLCACGYISIGYEYVGGTKEIARRYISLNGIEPLLDLEKAQALYAVVPSNVLSSGVSVNAKLLYAEISAATPTNGYCSKPSSEFAEIMNASEPTLRRWLKELTDAGFVRAEMEYKGATREIKRRRLYIVECLPTIADTPPQSVQPPDLARDGAKDVESSVRAKKNKASKKARARRKRSMLIFDPTSENATGDGKTSDRNRKRARKRLLLRL